MFRKTRLSLLAILLIACLGCAINENRTPRGDMDQKLEWATQRTQAVLNHMDRDLGLATTKVIGLKLDGLKTRQELQRLLRLHPYVVDACTINMRGTIVAMEPLEFVEWEGENIMDQEQVQRVQKTRAPVLSKEFRAVEGFSAVDLEHPIFTIPRRPGEPAPKMLGSMSLLIRPAYFLKPIVQPMIENSEWDCWVMQSDGVILYDMDEEEIGRNLLTDPMYEDYQELLKAGRAMTTQPRGETTYTFPAKGLGESVTKSCKWDTVSLHGTEWRVVMCRQIR